MANPDVEGFAIYFKPEFWAACDDNKREQLAVFMQAYEIFSEREGKYKSLWQQYGAVDSYQHVRSKAARTQFYLEGHEDESDPIDLINYAVFLVRNVRAGRMFPEDGGEASVVDTWRVIDRWWSQDPDVKEYRLIELSDGSKITQRRLSDEDDWTV